ncbi:MAG: iron ABC transporter [Candidatus Melainabacteria bacterium HGW-Melainabacteria-1]|nr:MAG: iron ABC transporter [Candidatus Melainabacteria bacterium HGW-Melainabacteria-1]
MRPKGQIASIWVLLLGLVLLAGGGFVVWGWSQDAPHWAEIWQWLSGGSLDETDRYILLELRLPRIVLGLLAGMMLAAAGLVLQGLFRNPLMDPFILGVSGGGALGAGLAILLGIEFWFFGLSAVTLLAFGGSLAVVWLVYRLGRYRGALMMDRLLLSGVALSALCSALLSLVLVLKGKGLDQVVYWIMGSLTGKSWQDVITLLPFACLGMPLLIRSLHALNLMQTGEETSLSLGLQPERTKWGLILAATLLSSAVVSVCGVIGFVGLMVPHMARLLLRTSDFRRLLLPCLILGGLLLMLADGLSRNLLTSQEIPVGIFTALLGVPFFLSQLTKQ